MINRSIYVDIIKLRDQLNRLENFEEFRSIYRGSTKEELLEYNSKLDTIDFSDLIEEYYD